MSENAVLSVSTSRLVFIDAGVDHLPQLLSGIKPGSRVQVLAAGQDGVEQISQVLAGQAVESIAIVAHGVPGGLRLGSSELGLATLGRYSPQLSQWFLGVTAPRIDLYGCHVAAGDAGAEFVAQLQRLTGASIAASPHVIGDPTRGGTWELEGAPVASVPFTSTAMAEYAGVLAGDDFENATDITDDNFGIGNNEGFDSQVGEPIHDPTVSGLSLENQVALNNSAWWQWTAPESGLVTVSTAASTIDTALAVYTGATLGGLTRILDSNPDTADIPDTLTFTASAGTTYYLAVDGVNDAQGDISIAVETPPVIASGQEFQVSESAATGDPLTSIAGDNVVDAEPAADLTWSIVAASNPDNDGDGLGAFAIDNTGSLTVQDADDLNFEQFDTFYTLDVTADSGAFATTESVFVEVTNANDEPAIVSLDPSQTITNEGTRITLNGQIFDPDLEDVQTVVINWGDGSSTTVNSDDLVDVDGSGTKSFSRNHTYADNGAFDITVALADGGEDPVTAPDVVSEPLTITVSNVAPVINQGEIRTIDLLEDDSSTFQLTASDPSSVDTAALFAWTVAAAPGNGVVSTSTGSGSSQLITYTPDENFSGTDSFQIQVADKDGGTDLITVNVNVAAQPDAPGALTLNTSADVLNEGESLTLSGSFTDPDAGDTFTVTVNWGDGSENTVLANEALTPNGDGTYSFSAGHTFAADTGGEAGGITVTVQDSAGAIASAVAPVTVNNVAPAVTPGPTTSFSVAEDTPGTITLTASDPADSTFTWTIATDGANGTATVSADPTTAEQVITYTPTPNFAGLDEFVVEVSDGDGGTSQVTVVVGVDPVNDAPVNLNLLPTDAIAVDEGTEFTLSGNFQDLDFDLVPDDAIEIGDTHTVTIDWGDGTTTVVADDQLVKDGAGGIAFADIPHIYADEDTGTYTVTVTAQDAAGASVSATKEISVSNVAPVIVDPDGDDDGATQLDSAPEDGSLTFTLEATDAGVEDTLQWSILTQATSGSVAIGDSDGATQSFTYTPIPNFGGTDSFTLQVSDGDGGTDTIDVAVPVTASNDPPQILANQFDIVEGEVLEVTPDVLDAFDIETTNNAQIIFTIDNLADGDQFFVGDALQNTFSRADIIAGDVSFLGNGDEIAPDFTITVSDGTPADDITVPANITFSTVNDAPVLDTTDVPLVVSEGGEVLVQADNLSASDEETNDQDLLFTVENVVAGEFLVDGEAASQFTLRQINQGLVRFRHDDSEVAPSYQVTVSDGELTDSRPGVIDFTPVNDAPILLANNLTVTEGGSVELGPLNLDATDLETLSPEELTFTINDLTGGTFTVLNAAGEVESTFGDTGSFTLAQVLDGLVSFAQVNAPDPEVAGNTIETPPSYTVSVSDGELATDPAAADITFERINNPPLILRNGFEIEEGDSLILTSEVNLAAVDQGGETPQAELAYSVSNVEGGFFAFRDARTVPISEFTQNDVNLRSVLFVHDDSDTVPTYSLTVTDSEGGSTTDTEPEVVLTDVNDSPVISVNQLTLTEGDSVTLTRDNLLAIDEESGAGELTFTVGAAVQGGQFEFADNPGNAITEFTQLDVDNGLVVFVHDDTNTEPAYSLTVTDGSGAANGTSAESAATVSFTVVNDPPVITAASFTIEEGATVDITPDQLTASDEESDDGSLAYTVDSVANGSFLLDGDGATSFTQADIVAGRVAFQHDDSELAPAYTVTVADGDGESASQSVNLDFVNLNDLPQLLANQLTVTEGETVTLGTANLSASDLETLAPNLQFTIADIVGGTFTVVDIDGAVLDSFSDTGSFLLADVIEGRVSFTQENAADPDIAGNTIETPPSYTVRVDDGDGGSAPPAADPPAPAAVTFNRVNNAPVIAANGFTVGEGQTQVLVDVATGTPLIDAFDQVGETERSLLLYSVSDVEGGFFADTTATTVPITEFSQEDIDQGRVVFVHDDSDTVPTYSLTVTDSEGGSTTDTEPEVVLTDVNDSPVISVNQLTLTEGDSVTLTRDNLLAIDEESGAGELTFTVGAAVQGGQFEFADNPGNAITEFTQLDVDNGLVVFVHDDTNTEPAYSLTVTDGSGAANGTSAESAATVSFTVVNDPPVITAASFTIEEGATVDITPDQLTASDEESDDGSLAYTVDSVANGSFLLDGDGATSFTQADIVAGRVAFQHDDSELAPAYTVTVADGDGESASQSVNLDFVNLNNLPVFTSNALTVTEGEAVTLTLDNLSAVDDDDPDSQLLYSVIEVSGGEFLLDGAPLGDASFRRSAIAFGQLQFQHFGGEEPPAYTVQVTDPSGGSTAPEAGVATITFVPVNDDPVLTTNSFDFVEGELVTLTAANLQATDPESVDPAALTYSISNLTGGQFFLDSDPATAVTQFTQEQANDEAVVFIHDGSEAPPSFDITVSDPDGGSSEPAAANIASFTPQDDPPVITSNSLAVSEGGSVTLTDADIAVTDPDTDPTAITLSVTDLTGGAEFGGVFTVDGVEGETSFTLQAVSDGLVVFTDDGDETPPALQISASDGTTATAPEATAITFTPTNDAPVAADDAGPEFTTGEVEPLVTGDVLANDVDEDVDDTLTITQVEGTAITPGQEPIALASGALVTLNPDGRTFTYDPNGVFNELAVGETATDSFVYTVSDSAEATDTATVSILINGGNNAPTATDDSGPEFAVNRRSAAAIDVLANDVDLDGDAISITTIAGVEVASGEGVTLESGATVSLNEDGTLTYDAEGIFTDLRVTETRPDSFTYTVADALGETGTATVTMEVQGFTPPTDGYLDFARYVQLVATNTGVSIPFTPVEVGQVRLDLFFDETYYLANNSDIAAAVAAGELASGYSHFVTSGLAEGRNPSTLYNEQFYLEANPDVLAALEANSFSSGLQHFLTNGHIEGRNPSALFDQGAYLARYNDVAEAVNAEVFSSGFEHYVEIGAQEGRQPELQLFDRANYLAQNSDVAGAGLDPFQHYLGAGQGEGRDPSLIFDESSYLALNSDVQEAVTNGSFASGFFHYIQFGRAEGRAVFA